MTTGDTARYDVKAGPPGTGTLAISVSPPGVVAIVGNNPVQEGNYQIAHLTLHAARPGRAEIRAEYRVGDCVSTMSPVLLSVTGREPPVDDEGSAQITDVRRVPAPPAVIGIAAAVSAAAAPTDVRRGELSLHLPEEGNSAIWGNAFYGGNGDQVIKIDVLAAKKMQEIRVRARVTARKNKPVTDDPYAFVATLPAKPGQTTLDLAPGQVVTALAAKDFSPIRDIVEVLLERVVRPKGKPVQFEEMGTIRMTPKPNLIRITAAPLQIVGSGDSAQYRVATPSAITTATGGVDPLSISGGNLQPVRVGQLTREPLTVGVYFHPPQDSDYVSAERRTAADHSEDIVIPGQPVEFRVNDKTMLEFATGKPDLVRRTDANGLVGERVRALAELKSLPPDTNAGYEKVHDMTAVLASVAGGHLNKKPALLQEAPDNAPPYAANERHPGHPEENTPDVEDLPFDQTSEQSVPLAGIDATTVSRVLQVGPYLSAFPHLVGDAFKLVKETFPTGAVLFNVAPVAPVQLAKEIRIAFSAQALDALSAINRDGPLSQAPLLPTGEITATALATAQAVWLPLGVKVTVLASANDLPRTNLANVAAVLMMSTEIGQDRTAAIAAGPLDDRFFDATLNIGTTRMDLTRDTTVKGTTPADPKIVYPHASPTNAMRFQPSGASEPVHVGSVVSAESFRYPQNGRRTDYSARELGTFLGNVCAHEAGHQLGLLQPWFFCGKQSQGQIGHDPYRRNRLSYRAFRLLLMPRGPLVHRRVVNEPLGFDPVERQYIREVRGGH